MFLLPPSLFILFSPTPPGWGAAAVSVCPRFPPSCFFVLFLSLLPLLFPRGFLSLDLRLIDSEGGMSDMCGMDHFFTFLSQ